FEMSCATSGLAIEHLRAQYEAQLPFLFTREAVREMVQTALGSVEILERWTPYRLGDGRLMSVRPFGARCVHINAGNSPIVAALCVVRNAITRGDAVVKSPSNDPYTALAIGRTMRDLDPKHPLTRHYSVAYWKGGDRAFESQLYRNAHFEKIVA